MLAAGGDALLLDAGDDLAAEPGDDLRVAAERAVGDHRVGGVGVDVEHGGEVDIDVDRPQLTAEQPANATSQSGIVRGTDGSHGRDVGKPFAQSHDPAA